MATGKQLTSITGIRQPVPDGQMRVTMTIEMADGRSTTRSTVVSADVDDQEQLMHSTITIGSTFAHALAELLEEP